METILTTSFRTLIGFFVLLLLTRILEKKQLSQMTFFTYITGIALGNIAGDMVVHRDIKIVDGKVVTKNLKELNLSEDWLISQLRDNGVSSMKEVFFAELQSDGSIFVDKKMEV